MRNTLIWMSNINRGVTTLALMMFSLPGIAVATSAPTDQSDVREAVQRVFDQLKSRDYSSLYDVLPAS